MSDREKKLLGLFLLAGFLVLNFVALNLYQKKSGELKSVRDAAQRELDIAEMISESRQEVLGEMKWLGDNEPEPLASQQAEVKLSDFVEGRARSNGLQILVQEPPKTTSDPSWHFHRASVVFKVTGTERSLYRWFDAINIPSEFRITSSILLSPNPQDDTQIDCTVTVEQWFVPLPPSA